MSAGNGLAAFGAMAFLLGVGSCIGGLAANTVSESPGLIVSGLTLQLLGLILWLVGPCVRSAGRVLARILETLADSHNDSPRAH